MSSQFDYPFADLRSKQRAHLVRSLNDPAIFSHTDCEPDLRYYGLRAACLAVALGLLARLWMAGFGNPVDGPGWGNWLVIVPYALLVAFMVAVVLQCANRLRLTRMFGFRPGRYVFPFSIIDARTDTIGVTDLLHQARFHVVHHTFNGVYLRSDFTLATVGAKVHTFKIRNKARAERFHQRFPAQQAETRQAFEVRDLDQVGLLDPLVDLRKNKWVLPPRRNPVPGPGVLRHLWRRQALACAIVTALLAPSLWALRMAANDEAMYRQAQVLQTEAAYLGYLRHGSFHADAARAALPRVSFNEVARQNSVTALRKLLSRYPGAGLDEDVAAAIHVQYQNSMEKFVQQAVQTDPVLIAAVADLLDRVEARGDPSLPVRFVRPTTAQLGELDRALAQRGAGNGRHIIPASSYFANNSAAVRERRIIAGLQRAFRTVFPRDVLTLTAGAPKDNGQPVLDIHYEIEPSGAVYVAEKDDGRGFVGLLVRFDSALIASETAPQWRFKLDVKPPDHFDVQYREGQGASGGGPQDGQVYAVMAERAFDSLNGAITAAFFRPDSDIVMRTSRQTAAATRL